MLPLARLRVRRQLTEIRAADLRFLPQEATAFYNEIANLGLTPEQVAILETRTEGWIAGLQMALFSLEGKVDRSAFITAFAGDDRQMMDYLAHLGELARTEGIHLAAAYVVPVQTEPLLLANKIAWLRPDGSVDHEYEKNVPAPAVEPVRKGALPPQAIAAENGLIMSAAICYDYDFPRIANQIGRLGAGLVLLPSGARRGIDPMHTQISAFRAVENGHAIVRATNNGLSGAVSPVGRLLGWRIAGQVAVVTGAGWGTGFEAARALAWLGAHVCIAEVDRRTGHQAAGRIAAEFGEGAVSFLRTDVGNERSVARLARRSLWSVSQDNGSINQRKKENRI
jgi:predicted amidohydrolase